uniref:Uncharacterized protein n=1 Tax=Trichuris muris TaxID=70415 RepID=A0A5S6QU83_TRIMR
MAVQVIHSCHSRLVIILVPHFGLHVQSYLTNALSAPTVNIPRRYCISTILSDIPFDKTFMSDDKRSSKWNIGFRKAIQHDIFRTMIEIGMCDRYSYSKVRCFRDDGGLTKVWLEVAATATLDQMEKVTSAMENGFAKMGPYYAFSNILIWQEPSKACDVC